MSTSASSIHDRGDYSASLILFRVRRPRSGREFERKRRAHALAPGWLAIMLLASLGQDPVHGAQSASTPDRNANWDSIETAAAYARAERMLTWHTAPLVLHDVVLPHWLDGARFWYRVGAEDGYRFMYADAAGNVQRPLFDNDRLAAAMSLANDTSYAPGKLPFEDFAFDGADNRIRFRVRAREFRCDIGRYTCTASDTVPGRPASHVRSPDGRWDAFVEEHDLYVRPAEGGDAVRLTTDGMDGWAYGLTKPRANQLRRPTPRRPVLEWSPDSRRIAIQRADERNVREILLYSVNHRRPQGYVFPYAMPGDSIVPHYDIHIVDLETRTNVRIASEPQNYQVNGLGGIGPDSTWRSVEWTSDSERIFFTHANRGPKRIQLMVADARTGEARVVVKDSSRSYVELNLDGSEPPNWAIAADGDEIVWFSERDGWGHLYRFGIDGTLRNRITSGPWAVATLLHVDAGTGRVWFTARGREEGRDPYSRYLYVANLDGSDVRLLTEQDADHWIRFSPDGRFYVDTYSKVDRPPITELRTAEGRLIRTLENADISRLLETGWRAGEPFRVKARDGVTDLYGVMWKPSDFDSTRSYPIIDHIYPGPQIIASPKRFFPSNEQPALIYAAFGQVQALAELGFIVINVDAMGTPYRSKAFLNTWYGRMGDNGIPDHMEAIRQLAARHAWIDIDRVGIFGHSGGGFASTDAILRWPDFFDVAFSTSGNHDNRTYQYHWGEKYQGLLERDTIRGTDNYENQANYLLAENLKGRLFLVHGDLDDNVLPSLTLRVADALIRANKDFDLLILPDMDHNVSQDPYVLRRMWDHFVRYLKGVEPPADYTIKPPPT